MVKNYEILSKKDLKLLDKYKNELNNEELNQYLYCKGYYDKEFFGLYFLPTYITKPFGRHQKEILEKINSETDVNIIVARGHGKTTTIIIDLLHSLLYKTYHDQIYVANSGLGDETIGKIKIELETNELIQRVFGNLIPQQDKKTKEEYGAKKWKQKYLELLNGEKIETLTPGQPIRGKRPKRIIVDDIDKEAPSGKKAEKQMTWFYTSLYNTLLPGGKVVVIGTITGNLCLVKQLKNGEGFETIEYKAIENGVPIWPEMWSIKSLEDRKKKIGTLRFNQEYMNIPINSEDSVIKEEDIQFFDYEGFNKKFDFILMGIDPAISESETSDEFAITITGHIGLDKYILDNVGLAGSEKKLNNFMNKIEYLYDYYKVNMILVESNAFQSIMKPLLQERNMAAKGLVSTKDKMTRLLEYQGDFESGKIFFNRKKTISLLDQLLMYPDVDHDDRIDSMVLSLGLRKLQITKKKARFGFAG